MPPPDDAAKIRRIATTSAARSSGIKLATVARIANSVIDVLSPLVIRSQQPIGTEAALRWPS
jgi:hypothetical protein